jgi:hypothetical protein
MDLMMTYIFFIVLSVYVLYFLVEIIALHSFYLRCFDFGLTIYTKTSKAKYLKWLNKDGIYKGKEGKYVFISDERIGYFVTRFSFFRRFAFGGYSWGIPFTIFGVFQENSQEITVKYKISFRIVLIIVFWYVALFWYAFSTGQLKIIGIGILFIVITTMGLYIYYLVKRKKMLNILKEILLFLKK